MPYIIRHTQLLPRHIIHIFNRILSHNIRLWGGVKRIDSDCIKKGVSDASSIIADSILAPFWNLYPNLLTACQDVLPNLEPICSGASLRKVQRRLDSRKDDNVASPWNTLFDIGILGQVVEPSSEHKISDYYCYGEFHYNTSGHEFGLATDRLYCFHPVFIRKFSMQKFDKNLAKTIYPNAIDFII